MRIKKNKIQLEKKSISKRPDYKLKILFIGPEIDEKSELITNFIKSRFNLDYKSTLGVEIFTKNLEFEPGKTALLSIWDIGGEKRFELIRSTFYKGASGALLVFDLTSEKTYEEIKKWLSEIKKFTGKDFPLVLIGNKLDEIEEVGAHIDRDEVIAFARKKGITYIETSPKSKELIENTFLKLTSKIISSSKKK
ncbi:hypothetical protein LCGC14_0412840 [marine sediment metagenome]|uniref:GTP-binding protein n=1 Tax=marine sediment metagenome TaxID=412755 RepID=A0A0F9ST91_9ZZZZ